MAPIHVVIPLDPFGKPAPRARVRPIRGLSKRNVIAQVYNSREAEAYMRAAGAFMLKARNESGVFAPLDGLLRVELFAFHGDVPARLRKQHESGVLLRKGTKPDTDNIQKIIGDAGNKILWVDDAQIAEWSASKWYAQKDTAPRVELVVHRVDDHLIGDTMGA